jgi:predicted regulator of Ras-like GTPase activity (Roadblock/LC7/MglB family)
VVDLLNDMLARLRAENELQFAAVSADGMLVAADSDEGIDAEGICATAGDGYLVMTALGVELGRGESQLMTVEYADGTVIITPLEYGAVLVMLTSGTVNLGRLRLASRRFQAQYLESAATTAA